jgi:phage terminase large subunit
MTVQFPEKALPLFQPAPYKIMYGGRGGSKSWDMARAILALGAHRKLFVVCGREIQRSIKDSVHKLLSEQVSALGLDRVPNADGEYESLYEVQEQKILGKNGTEIVFVGVRNNITAIKSMEGIDIFWLTEATHVSNHTWDTLLPTVRRDPPFGPFSKGSEVWIDFNPDLASDDTYKRWVLDPPDDSVVVEVNWRDNPWFPEILRKQLESMKAKDYDDYLTVWEGKPRRALEGAIYAKELSAAISEGRIAPNIKYDRARGVTVSFDLGRSDMCALWFIQQVGMEHHAIDFYGNTGFGIDHYLEEIQRRKYLVKRILLPHDAAAHQQAASKTIERQVRDVYPGEIVKIVPKLSVANGINAVRQLFSRLYFAEGATADGILGLQHYQYGVNADTKVRTKEPLHNWASNPADSLRYYAVEIKEGNKPPKEEQYDYGNYSSDSQATSWMA